MAPQYSNRPISPLKNENFSWVLFWDPLVPVRVKLSVGSCFPWVTQISPKFLDDESSFQDQSLLSGSHLPVLAVLPGLVQLLIHEGHCLWAGSSNCRQLGPIFIIPTHNFSHPILATQNVTALYPILIVVMLIILEKWMQIMMMIHSHGVLSTHIMMEIMMMIHALGVLSTHIMAQGTLIKQDS